MAVRTKGLTVTIDGDTTGLTKALSNVNKEIKNGCHGEQRYQSG